MNDVVRSYPVSGDLNIDDAKRTAQARCYRKGAQAKLDTMRGLIRVRVVEVVRDCKGWIHGGQDIVVRVLETRAGYVKGEIMPARACDVVPTAHVVRRKCYLRLNAEYRYVTEATHEAHEAQRAAHELRAHEAQRAAGDCVRAQPACQPAALMNAGGR